MERKRKAQRIVGLVLLVVLLVPVIILSIPSTYTEVIYHTSQDGFATIVEPEFVEIEYIPLINVFQNSQFSPIDIAFMVGYVAILGLAIWLIAHSRRYRTTQWTKQQSVNKTG